MLLPSQSQADAHLARSSTSFLSHCAPAFCCKSCIVFSYEGLGLRVSLNSGVVLEKVCEYLYYNLKHKDQKDVPDMEISPELCLELLMAADYLDV